MFRSIRKSFFLNNYKWSFKAEEAEDVIINLALEYLIESLEESKTTELGQDRITALKESCLAMNFTFIKTKILK